MPNESASTRTPLQARRSSRSAARAAGAVLALLALRGPAAAADGWIAGRASGPAAASAESAGYGANGVLTGLYLTCRGTGRGTLRLVVAVEGWRFDGAPGQTVAVSVDGTAYLFPSTPSGGADGGNELVHAGAFASFAPLIEALRRGKRVEVSTPLGRYVLPLSGSGKALAALKAGCG